VDKKDLESGLDRATGDRELEGEGKLDNLKGKVKDKVGDLRESAEDKLDDLDRNRGDH
jgi:uncharacterized protein YjbJ (UPF0337 family)